MNTEAGEATTVRRANRLASRPASEPRSSDMIRILNQYHAEVENHVGLGQPLIPRGFLPLGVIKMMREKRVTWRMVL
jgi:hypothetical protein